MLIMKMTVNRIIYQCNFLRVKKTKSRSLDRFLIQSAKINQIDRFNFHTAYHLSSDQGVPDRYTLRGRAGRSLSDD